MIQHLGANSLKRFQMEKRIRSHEFGLQGCYFIRKLAANLGEPQRSYALNAIDRAIQFWKGKRVPRCLPLRAPWILSPTWSSDLRKMLRQHCALMRPHTVTFQSPSTAVVFTKNPSVQDSLCNHKDYATRWADGETPVCICSTLTPYQTSPTSNSHHLHLDGDSLTLPTPSLSSIANGSLQNKIYFPPRKRFGQTYKKPLSNGINEMAFRLSLHVTWKICGTLRGHNIASNSTTTFHTTTSLNLPNSFQGPSSTMKTNGLLLCASTAPSCTLSASRIPFRMTTSSNA